MSDTIYVARDEFNGYMLCASHDLDTLKAEVDKLDRPWSSGWRDATDGTSQRFYQHPYSDCHEVFIDVLKVIPPLDTEEE